MSASLSHHAQQPSFIPRSVPTEHVDMTHSLAPVFIAVALIVPLLGRHLYHDYKAFIALGPGGTEQTIKGYLKLKFLGLLAIRDPYEAPPLPHYLVTKTGYFKSPLPQRIGRRPRTVGIAPHRQTNQWSPAAIYAALAAAIEDQAFQASDLQIGTSCFELHSTGLFCTNPERRTCGGEVCHAHPSDGSMHLTLHPADAKTVLESNWGERHPLAKGGWMERFVPGGFVLVYAPRSEEEVQIVMQIVHAATWWVAGREIGKRHECACETISAQPNFTSSGL